jgi:hypothetical protein
MAKTTALTSAQQRSRPSDDLVSALTGYVCLELRINVVKPMSAATMPPINIHTALSVGEPVKKRDTSELKEFVALMPTTMRAIPPMRMASDNILFIVIFGL